MEQHPIPQNITGFEFKLIGDMTIKQFAYLAGCVILAYLTFASPLHPLIKFPLVVFLAIFGIALAFVPVEGRPLDRWISNFIHALFAPSQYIFHKEGASPDFLRTTTSSTKPMTTKGATPIKLVNKNDRFRDYLHTLSPSPLASDNEEQAKLSAITDAFFAQKTPLAPPLPITPPPAQPTPILSGFQVAYQTVAPTVINPHIQTSQNNHTQQTDEEKRKKELELLDENQRFLEENKKLREQLEEIRKRQLAPQSRASEIDQQKTMQDALAIQGRLQEALSEKERLASELTKLKATPRPATQTVRPTPPPPPKPSEKVRVIPREQAKTVGVAGLTQFPNLVAGILKDTKGDILPNIIVEVKDASGNPVRAFKTNKLGQFSAATSLSSGKYTIELEDPKNTYTFEVIAIELTGGFFQPLEIIAKDQMPPERQQLYQSLFGNKTM